MYITLLLIPVAYLIGSVPTSVWVGKFFYGVDIREHGSKNAGATNTFRILGKKAGIPVLIVDIMKGWLAVQLVNMFGIYEPNSIPFVNFQLVFGLAALVGHIFPVFAQFRGGKGVATLVGVGLSIHPAATSISIGIFLIILLLFHYVSLGSIIGGLFFPFLLIFIFKIKVISLILFSISISVMLFVTHKKNISRLLRGEEAKSYIFKRRKDKLKMK